MCAEPCPRCGSQHYAQQTGETPCDRDVESPLHLLGIGAVCLLLIIALVYIAFQIGRWLL